MEAPALVRILGSDVEVVFLPSVAVDNEQVMGTYEQEQSRILIKSSMSRSSVRDTLVHEIIHAILQHYEMDSEKIVRILTPAIVSIIRDNPQLISFLTAGTESLERPGYEQQSRQEY
jgi:hypothetical protein